MDVPANALSYPADDRVEILPANRVSDDATLLADDLQVIQHALDRLAIEVSRCDMCFAPSKCKYFKTGRSLYLHSHLC